VGQRAALDLLSSLRFSFFSSIFPRLQRASRVVSPAADLVKQLAVLVSIFAGLVLW